MTQDVKAPITADLPLNAGKILETLKSIQKTFNKIVPSHQAIADKLGICRRTVIRWMKWLRDHHLITWKGQMKDSKHRTVNRYFLKNEGVTARKDFKPGSNSNLNNNNITTSSLSYIVPNPSKIPELINKSTAQEFITHWFGQKPVTFQVMAETEEAKQRKKQAESRGDYRYTNRVFHGTLEENWGKLVRYNQNGYGIHIAVNDTDGKGRKVENTTHINGFFLDLDGGSLEPVVDFTKRFKCEPSIIVESSPGKYHVYWKTDHCPMQTWSGIQKTIAKRFSGDGNSMAVNKTLRLPGFVHLKSEPVMTKIIHTGDSIFPYARARKLFPVEPPKPVNRDFKPTGQMWNGYSYGVAHSSDVSRNCEMYKFVCKMRAFDIDRYEAEQHAINYALSCSPPLRQQEGVSMVRRVWKAYQPNNGVR